MALNLLEQTLASVESDYCLIRGRATISGAIACIFRKVAAVVSAERVYTIPVGTTGGTAPTGSATATAPVRTTCLPATIAYADQRTLPAANTGT
jgi:hypothetical protein